MTTDADTGYGDDGPIVSAAWLRSHIDDPAVRVVDARPAAAYAAGHLPGSVHLDLYQPDLKLRDSSPAERTRFHAAVSAALGQIAVRPGERVVFTEDVSGTLAARGVWLLDYLGHGGGALLDGGLHAWVAGGGALTRDVPAVDPSVFTPSPVPELLATADEIQAAVTGQGGMTVLDTRADQEYAAATIPSAIHLEWVQNLRPDGALRPPAELRPVYAAAGVAPDADRRVVTFCGSGFRAAQTYVVLRALGYPRVANYSPSWGEWSRLGARS